MIGVDVGSKVTKWFDGRFFGTGLPEGRGIVAGISARTVFIKRSFYPLCRGHQLKKVILNDVSSDIGVLPEEIAVSFCPVKREKEGCELLVFVEKRETLQPLEESFKDLTAITVDIIGVATAARLVYGEDELTVIDAGASKTAVVEIVGGKLKSVEIVRAGFEALKSDLSFLEDRIFPLVKSKRAILVGGGALDDDFVRLLKERLTVEIPNIEPFGGETPLYFGAFGLFHFRKSSCRASFKELSLFSSEFFTKNKGKLIASAFMVLSGLLFLSAAEYLSYLQAKRNYLELKKEYKKAVERILGERVVAPEEQLSQALSRLERLRELLLLDKPSVLLYVSGVSKAVVNDVKILKVEGSSAADSFKLTGLAKSSGALKNFTDRLKSSFSKVNTDVTKETDKGIKFTITVSGVKGGA
ncbi:hypothetical protein [Phorcysia thermohydrogeniphila]|uniref:Type IV pilus assembly protein PilM n=1 Tax=Phorcysia thermohydrogeniphila TaxID=936138 RepID=A0A4R1GFM5_9BACT|nr:hypothetical protein [Phorcysia thermohydrogeniphila]TCK04639.1 hypothetical protein CLV27_1072 [Phorcysia thermohydrogeniphila]